MKHIPQTTAALAIAALCGCASLNDPTPSVPTELNADERGPLGGLGPESQELVVIAEEMARSLVGIPEIANAEGSPKIILAPVENDTRFPIRKGLFLRRIRATLIKHARDKMTFLERERINELEAEIIRKRTGQVTGGEQVQANEFKGADFILTGKLIGLSMRGPRGASDYIFYSFQLVNIRTSEIVWEDFHEVKKQGLDDLIFR